MPSFFLFFLVPGSDSLAGTTHPFLHFELLFKPPTYSFPNCHRAAILRDFRDTVAVGGGRGWLSMHRHLASTLRARALRLFLLILPAHWFTAPCAWQ